MTDQVGDTTLAAQVPLRVAVWNLNHWQQPVRPIDTRTAAWQYIADDLRADVALLQETVPPRTSPACRVVYREIADYRPWGSAVASFRDDARLEEIWAVSTRWDRRRRFTLAKTFPGSVAVYQAVALSHQLASLPMSRCVASTMPYVLLRSFVQTIACYLADGRAKLRSPDTTPTLAMHPL